MDEEGGRREEGEGGEERRCGKRTVWREAMEERREVRAGEGGVVEEMEWNS